MHQHVVTNRRYIAPCPAFAHMQPTTSTIKERQRCCKENRSEDICTKGFITIVNDSLINRTLSEIIEEHFNETRFLQDAYSCPEPNCLQLLPNFEMTERLVGSIHALPIYLRHVERRSINFGNEEIRILTQQDGEVTFTLIGCLQFTGIFFEMQL